MIVVGLIVGPTDKVLKRDLFQYKSRLERAHSTYLELLGDDEVNETEDDGSRELERTLKLRIRH